MKIVKIGILMDKDGGEYVEGPKQPPPITVELAFDVACFAWAYSIEEIGTVGNTLMILSNGYHFRTDLYLHEVLALIESE